MEFRSLESMLESGKSINEIFEGPRLHNGFINDEDLVKKIKVLNATTFVTPIKEVEGVLHVRSLFVNTDETADEDDEHLDIDAVDTGFWAWDRYPYSATKSTKTANSSSAISNTKPK